MSSSLIGELPAGAHVLMRLPAWLEICTGRTETQANLRGSCAGVEIEVVQEEMQIKLLRLQGDVAGLESDAAAQAADAAAAQAQAADARARALASSAELQQLREERGAWDQRTSGLRLQLEEAREKLVAAEAALGNAVKEQQVGAPPV